MYRLLLFPLSRCVPLSPWSRCRWCRRHLFTNLKSARTLYCATGLSWKQLRLTGAGIAHLTSSSSSFKTLHIINETKSSQIHSSMIILIIDCPLLFQPTSIRIIFFLFIFVHVRRVLFFYFSYVYVSWLWINVFILILILYPEIVSSNSLKMADR